MNVEYSFIFTNLEKFLSSVDKIHNISMQLLLVFYDKRLFIKHISFIFFMFFGVANLEIKAQSKIYWQADRPLEFSDFKAKPTHGRIAALSYCGIKYNSCPNQRYSYEVSAFFEPYNSWAWKNYQYSYVIQHERRHFDIAEIYSRKLRKYFAEHEVPYRKANAVYEKYYEEFEAYQNLYDQETHHGTHDSHQAKWNQKIAQELENLENFAEDKCY